MSERESLREARSRHRYRIDGVRYVWVGAYNGDYSLFGDNSGGWIIADPDACAAEGIHHPRITGDLGMYCSRCGKYVTLRDAFTSDEDFEAHIAEAGKRADELRAAMGWSE